MRQTPDLDAIFRMLAERLEFSCIEEAEYIGQRRWFENIIADADPATLAARKSHAASQLKQLDKLTSNIGKALDALDAIDPIPLALLAAQSGDMEQFRNHAARIKDAAQPSSSLAARCANLPCLTWPSQGGVNWQARLIALMIEHLYVLKRKKRPTFGRNTHEPSRPAGEFGQLVKSAFAVGGVAAEWEAAVRWALKNGMSGLFRKKCQ
jgi:hypothetical protein